MADVFPNALHVRDLGLGTADDREIWDRAQQDGLTIISKDADFHQMSLLYGPPPKVIWLRVGNVSTAEIENLLRPVVNDIVRFVKDEHLAILTLSK